jgi:hypothetical protein
MGLFGGGEGRMGLAVELMLGRRAVRRFYFLQDMLCRLISKTV